jgi:hypothetical protein
MTRKASAEQVIDTKLLEAPDAEGLDDVWLTDLLASLDDPIPWGSQGYEEDVDTLTEDAA